jgi:hypothetical protein
MYKRIEKFMNKISEAKKAFDIKTISLFLKRKDI